MPIQLNRSSLLVGPFAACTTALLIAAQLVIAPAAAAPAHEDAELTVTPRAEVDEAAVETDEAAVEAVDDAEGAAEPVDDAGEEAVEPAPDEAEPAAELAVEADEAADEPVEVAEEPAGGPSHDVRTSAAPSRHDDPVDDPFLLRLLDAINERRERNGIRPLAFVPASATAALDSFFVRTAADLGWPGPCSHDFSEGALAWDAVTAAGFGGAPRGEVLACPGPEPYWTPDRTAERWWDSPIHFGVLYADDDSSSIACSAYGVRGGANESGKQKRKSGGSPAASAVICVTFQG